MWVQPCIPLRWEPGPGCGGSGPGGCPVRASDYPLAPPAHMALPVLGDLSAADEPHSVPQRHGPDVPAGGVERCAGLRAPPAAAHLRPAAARAAEHPRGVSAGRGHDVPVGQASI